MSLDIFSSSKLQDFLSFGLGKLFASENKIIYADKYWCIFVNQVEGCHVQRTVLEKQVLLSYSSSQGKV